MFLKKLQLKNFKCLANIELSFDQTKGSNRAWTLILGENGTGKSNLLKAIALVTCGSNGLSELLGDTDSWIKNGENSCHIKAVLTTKTGEEREVSLTINRNESFSTIISTNLESLQKIDEAINYADRNYFTVGYGAGRRLPSSEMLNLEKYSARSRALNVRSLFSPSATLNPLTSWIINLDYSSGEKGIAIVKETLNNFLPNTSFHSIDKEKRQVLFATVDGIVPLEYLSDGYQNMAAWIGDLLFRVTETFSDYKNPLSARGILLIDELDLHLHPKWQRQLLDFISQKLPNFQVIATTHSALTAQQASEGELFALKRNSFNQIELISFVGNPRYLLVNQLLMTPVFGLETDESFEIEKLKELYEELRNKSSMTDEDTKKLRKIGQLLQEKAPKRVPSQISEQSIDLLTRLEENLKLL